MHYSRTIVDQVFKEGTPIILPVTSLENGKHISGSIENMAVKSLMCAPAIHCFHGQLAKRTCYVLRSAKIGRIGYSYGTGKKKKTKN